MSDDKCDGCETALTAGDLFKRWEQARDEAVSLGNEVERLNSEVAGLRAERDSQEAGLRSLRDHLASVREELARVTKASEDKDLVIQGFDARERLRKDSVRVLEVGQEVTLGDGVSGKIRRVLIDRAGVSYQVAYWANSRRLLAIFPAEEVEVLEDRLAYPGEDGYGGSHGIGLAD